MRQSTQGAKLELVEAIRFNTSMAATLCSYHALDGSWKGVLKDLQKVAFQAGSRICLYVAYALLCHSTPVQCLIEIGFDTKSCTLCDLAGFSAVHTWVLPERAYIFAA